MAVQYNLALALFCCSCMRQLRPLIRSVLRYVEVLVSMCLKEKGSSMNKNSDRHYIFAKIADKSHVLRRIGEPRCKAVLYREVGVQVDAFLLSPTRRTQR